MSNKREEVQLDIFAETLRETLIENPYTQVKAKFTPIRRDDLKPDTDLAIGLDYIWESGWVIEDGDYKGDVAMVCIKPYNHDQKPRFTWTPLCDLSEVEVIDGDFS